MAADDPDIPKVPWLLAALIVLGVGICCLGLSRLLTSSARADIGSIEERFRPGELSHAKKPGEAPEPGTPAYADWLQAEAIWKAKLELGDRQATVDTLGRGLLFAWILQTGIIGFIVFRQYARVKSELSRRARAASRPA